MQAKERFSTTTSSPHHERPQTQTPAPADLHPDARQAGRPRAAHARAHAPALASTPPAAQSGRGVMKKTTAHGRKLKRQQAIGADPHALYRLIGNVMPFTPQELATLKTPPRVAFESLRMGHGDEHDFHTLAAVTNNTLVCAESIHPDCIEVAKRGQDALMGMLDRMNRLGKWGLDSQALQDLPPVLDLHEQLLDLYTPLQMRNAMKETMRRMKAGETLAPEDYNQPIGSQK